MKGLMKKLGIVALLLVPATSAYADTCQYKNTFSLAYPGTDYAIDMGGGIFLSTNQSPSDGPSYNQDLSSLVANLNSDVTPQLPFPVTGSWSMSGSVLRSPSFSSTLGGPGILPIGSYDGISIHAGTPPLIRVCTPDPVVVAPSGLLAAMDTIVGKGVSGIGDLFRGNFGQIIIFFIAVVLAGALLGAFWYLKSKVSNSAS